MNIKVLTIMSRLEMGGIEKTLLSCIPFFKKKGVDIHILCTKGGSLDEGFEKEGVTIVDFEGKNKPILDAFHLKKVLANTKYDIVHSRYGHTSGLFAKFCHSKNIPFLISVHNEKAMFRPNWKGKLLLGFIRKKYLVMHAKLSKKYSTKILGHSKANLKYFTSDYTSNPNLYKVVYNGVDFSKFENNDALDNQIELDDFLKDSRKTFINIASFKHQKNHDFLLNVFNGLNPVENNYKLLLLGTGSLLKEIKEKAIELNIISNVYFTGVVTNIKPYLQVSDIFFFPSLYEGFGNVLIEAQYMNVSIFASDIAPHYEAAYKSYHQYFYSPTELDETVQKLKQCVKDIDNGKHNVYREDAFNFSQNFSIENMVESLSCVYESEINNIK